MILKYAKPSRQFERNRFTLDEFVVNGVNLAQYGMEQGTSSGEPHPLHEVTLTHRYELFDNFEIEGQIGGNETWWDLVHYLRDLKHKSLIFYMDKVSQKR